MVTLVPPETDTQHGEAGIVGSYGDRVRLSLLESAEELFATHGIDAVSSRRIAEHAGNANHSAVNYHFGNRDELIRAMLLRYADDTRERRRELAAQLGPEPRLRDLVRCLVLPFTEQLATLPVPSRRARFLRQLRSVPSVVEIVATNTVDDPLMDDLIRRTRSLLSDVPDSIMRGRSWILGRMVVDICAEYEARVEADPTDADWAGMSRFLVDVCVGVLRAEITDAGDYVGADAGSAWP